MATGTLNTEIINIKKGDKGDVVSEINIRLMGFGGGLPSEDYNDYTVKVVKQFKKDYMKQANPDGNFVDMPTIEAIDKFAEEYPITEVEFNQMKCPCKKCNGFGNGLKEPPKDFDLGQKKLNEWNKSKIESNNPYEYPGMHKTIPWLYRVAKFYLKQNNYSINAITAGYRCWYNNMGWRLAGYTTQDHRATGNHFGKALDITISNLKGGTIVNADLDGNVRTKIFKDIMGGHIGWISNKIGLEPRFNSKGEPYAPRWIHYDIREFSKALTKDFFTKSKDEIINPNKLKNLI